MIFKEKHKDVNILKLKGSLDATSVGEADRVFHKLKAEKAKKVILDMSGLNYINSMGIERLIMLYHDMQDYGGRMMVTSLQPVVKEIFEITKLELVIDVFPDKDTAMSQFRK